MTKRQQIICSYIPESKVFADVGCDHGYMAQYALENGLCERAYITDISRESLKKAETLLEKYIKAGVCVPVCTDGMRGLPEQPDCVLIAGMGGEEILKILSESGIPEKFVLQPMKNAEKVRAYLSEQGCKILYDYTFKDGKFYELIAGERNGGKPYTQWEIAFGRGNLSNPQPAFVQKIKKEMREVSARLSNPSLSEQSKEKLQARRCRLEVIISAIEDDL